MSSPAGADSHHGTPGPSHEHGLRVPLLDDQNHVLAIVELSGEDGFKDSSRHSRNSFWTCTINLCKVILGAGVMALPKAVYDLGLICGGSLLLAVPLLTVFTANELLHATEQAGQRMQLKFPTRELVTPTYVGMMGAAYGKKGERVAQVAIVSGLFGILVAYTDIIGDVLVGEGNSRDGLVQDLVPESFGQSQLFSRSVVVFALMVCVLGPLTARRSMASLGLVNVMGLISLSVFAAAMVWVACAAILNGTAHMMPLLPTLSPDLGSTWTAVAGFAGLIPIVLTADACHTNLHPILSLLKPYSTQRMQSVVASAMVFVNVIYVIVVVGACAAFGPGIREDMLNNMSASQIAPLIGETQGVVVSLAVRLGYLVSLIGSITIIMFPVRDTVLEALFTTQLDKELYFHAVTVTLLAGVYLVAVFVPSMWIVLSLVGSLSVTTTSFIMPAMLVWEYRKSGSWPDCSRCALAGVVFVMGLGLLINGVFILF